MDVNILLQIVITTIAIIVTYYAAIKGAERGARLNELATIDREEREWREEQKRLEQQVKAIRLLLALEIRQNLIDLNWLVMEMTKFLGEEIESYYSPSMVDNNPEAREWLEARQRFISLQLPDWAHRCWYYQQSSYLVTVAVGQEEIRKISRHHSQLERLTKIKNMLTERAAKTDRNVSAERAASTTSSSFEEDAPQLWKEFVSVYTHTLAELGNPLGKDLEKAGVDVPIGPAIDMQMPGSRPAQIEAGPAVNFVKSASELKSHIE